MSIKDLEQAIQELLNRIYKVNYLRPIVIDRYDNLYTWRLELGVYEKPIYINIEAPTDEDFLEKLEKELRIRKLHYVYYFRGYEIKKLCNEREY